MKVAVVYVFPQVLSRTYYPLAMRFGSTWRQHPPGAEPHELYVIGNGSAVPEHEKRPFDGIPGVQYLAWSNIGWDIGAFQYFAEAVPCDLMVCLGSPVHFHRDGWLDRMVESFLENSPALFGCWGVPFRTYWHIRTTAFWLPPELLRSYPNAVSSNRASRYEFEHGKGCLTNFAERAGFPPLMVTWSGTHAKDRWESADGGPDQSLVFDQFTHR